MKWMTMAAITLALLFVCVFLVINKQEQLSVITNEVQTYMGQRDTLQKEVGDLRGIVIAVRRSTRSGKSSKPRKAS